MKIVALFDFIPQFCPNCGVSTNLDKSGAGDYGSHKVQVCQSCRLVYQLASQRDLLRAATASGGDIVEHFSIGD